MPSAAMRPHSLKAANAPLARLIGERIRTARTAAGLTQKQAAGDRYTGAYVSALENGLVKPSLAALSYLADQLGVRLADLVDDGKPVPTYEPEVRRQLAAIEERLSDTRDLLELLLASRLMRDGHASTWIEAVRLARDLPRVTALYPEEADG